MAWPGLPSRIAGPTVVEQAQERAEKVLKESQELIAEGVAGRRFALATLDLLRDAVSALAETDIDLAAIMSASPKSDRGVRD